MILIFAGNSRDARIAAVHRYIEERTRRSGTVLHEDTSAALWPFQRNVTPTSSRPAAAIWVRDLHDAFSTSQSPGTRLVLTQSTYQLQRWLDWLESAADTILIADAHRRTLSASAPEAFARRGPWAQIEIVEVDGEDAADAEGSAPRLAPGNAGSVEPSAIDVSAAFRQPDAGRRMAVCMRAANAAPRDAALHLACSSACMELSRWDEARQALERAQAIAPGWEAVHFEKGKLWLRLEDTERAAAAFAEAGRLMPRFAAASSNLGAALGELGRSAEALVALEAALRADPHGYTTLNNIGTVFREQGRLEDAESTFRQVIAAAPGFVFGYYNLGHTMFLAGRFSDARAAYEEGFERDAQKNARQACRLAVARAAAGDADGALELLSALGEGLPRDSSREMFDEAESTLTVLSAIPGVNAGGISRVREFLERYSS